MRVNLQSFVKKNGATILTCVGAIGVVGTAILTAKGTTKANLILKNIENARGEKVELPEKIKYALPSYIPAIVMGVGTVTCIFGANLLNKKQQASLLSAYTMLDRSYKEYRKKVEELYGKEADDAVEEALQKKHCPGENDLQLFYDEYSDRYFESTYFKVQKAEYELNRYMLKRDYAYLNEWYEELDIDTIEHGYDIGWATFQCLEMYWQPWIDFDHYKFTTEGGRECTGICIVQQPILDFADYC